MISKKENPFLSLAFNIILPVLVLKYLKWTPLYTLLVALALPLGYGIWSFVKEKKVSLVSLLGFLNTLFTGGFVVLALDGQWFAVKEAAFPLLIGIFVWASAYKKNPFLNTMLIDSGAFNGELISEKVKSFGRESDYKELIQKMTVYFSFTFFVSAILNFVLAIYIFTDIPAELEEAQRATILNDQVARMTWMGYIVIMIPSMILFGLIMYRLVTQLTKLTELSFEELVKN